MIYDNTYMFCMIAGIIDYIIYMEYQKKMLQGTGRYTSLQNIGIVAAILMDIVCYYDFLYYNRYDMYIILAFIMLFIYRKSSDICVFITNTVYHICTAVSINVIVRFFLETYSFTRVEKHISDISSEIICITMVRILLIIFINIYDKYVGIQFGKTAGIAIIFTSLSTAILIIMLSRIGYAYTEAKHRIVAVLIVLWIVMNAIDILINTIEQNNRYSYELIMLDRERETNRKIYNNIKAGQEELRNIRHDIKNRLNALRVVISQNDSKAALDYLDGMIGSVDMVKGKIYCNNLLINNILTYKLDSLPENIELECQAEVSEQINIDMGDMGVIIGNLLDNSIKAVESISKGGYIHIIITESIGRLIIIVENNYIKDKEKKPVSYYVDHGRGVNNVRRIVKKYGGTYKENVSENMYRTKITIDMK